MRLYIHVHITKMIQKIAWTCLVVGEWHYSSLKPWWELSQVSLGKHPKVTTDLPQRYIVSGTPTWLKESGRVNFYMDTPLRFNMVHLKISPWKRRFRTWKPSCSCSMLNNHCGSSLTLAINSMVDWTEQTPLFWSKGLFQQRFQGTVILIDLQGLLDIMSILPGELLLYKKLINQDVKFLLFKLISCHILQIFLWFPFLRMGFI